MTIRPPSSQSPGRLADRLTLLDKAALPPYGTVASECCRMSLMRSRMEAGLLACCRGLSLTIRACAALS